MHMYNIMILFAFWIAFRFLEPYIFFRFVPLITRAAQKQNK